MDKMKTNALATSLEALQPGVLLLVNHHVLEDATMQL